MRRVSSATANNDIQYNLRLQESRVNNLNNQLGSQNRLQQLRDDPLAAGHLVRYQSYATRVEQFEKNAKIISDDFTVAEGYVNQSVQIMQRVRELAVNGANGYYEKEEDVLSFAVFEQVAENFFKWRAAQKDGVDREQAKSSVYPV